MAPPTSTRMPDGVKLVVGGRACWVCWPVGAPCDWAKEGDMAPITPAISKKTFDNRFLSTGQKMSRNLLYDIKRSEQMASL